MPATLAVPSCILMEVINLFSESWCWGAFRRLRENQEGFISLLCRCQVYMERNRHCRMARQPIPSLGRLLGGDVL